MVNMLAMKKNIPVISMILFFFCSPVAVAGTIAGSAHDFRGYLWNTSGEICKPCQGEDTLREDPLVVLAHCLAEQFNLAESSTARPLLLDRLLQHESVITDAHQQFSNAAQEVLPLPYAAEWLLDNFFVVQQTIRQIREDLPPGYYRELPKLQNSAWLNIPRNYAIASEIIEYSNYQLGIDQIVRFLQAFQGDAPRRR